MRLVDGERLDETPYQNDDIRPSIGQPTLDFSYKQMQAKGVFWYLQATREPLCGLELMQRWSDEVGQPPETPLDIT